MEAGKLSWLGWTVDSPSATWVCTTSCVREFLQTSSNTFMPDGIEYDLEFSARNKVSEAVPDTRRLRVRTSSFKITSESDFLHHLSLVIDGQMLDDAPWDRFKEVYERD